MRYIHDDGFMEIACWLILATTWGLKFFNLLQPDVAIFGQKDAMQCVVIARMLEDLLIMWWWCRSAILQQLDSWCFSLFFSGILMSYSQNSQTRQRVRKARQFEGIALLFTQTHWHMPENCITMWDNVGINRGCHSNMCPATTAFRQETNQHIRSNDFMSSYRNGSKVSPTKTILQSTLEATPVNSILQLGNHTNAVLSYTPI